MDGPKLSRKFRYRWLVASGLRGLAGTAYEQRQYERAARLFAAEEAAREELGDQIWGPTRANLERRVTSARQAMGDAAFNHVWAEGRAMTLERAIEYVLAEEPEQLGG